MTATSPLPHLFGVAGAEIYYDDPETVYENDIDSWRDHTDTRTRQIEEWSARPCSMPPAAVIVEDLAERFSDSEEAPDDDGRSADRIVADPAVIAAAEALRSAASVAASKGYRWTDRLVATHEVTWDAAGDPLLNGVPLYASRPRPAVTR